MNCYQKILQKNVYRTCAGNCNEIASVTTFHRNDKGLATSSELSSRTQCGDLLASRLPRCVFYTARNDKNRAASVGLSL